MTRNGVKVSPTIVRKLYAIGNTHRQIVHERKSHFRLAGPSSSA